MSDDGMKPEDKTRNALRCRDGRALATKGCHAPWTNHALPGRRSDDGRMYG